MNKLIKIIKKMPLKFQHWIRSTAHAWEFQTTKLVIDEPSIIHLIQNTDSPNFEEFDIRLDNMKKKWKTYDCELQQLDVIRSLREFQFKNKLEKNKIESIK